MSALPEPGPAPDVRARRRTLRLVPDPSPVPRDSSGWNGTHLAWELRSAAETASEYGAWRRNLPTL